MEDRDTWDASVTQVHRDSTSSDPSVEAAKIRGLLEQVGPPTGMRVLDRNGPPMRGDGGLMESQTKKTVDRIVALLTTKQQNQWAKLVGAPFEGGWGKHAYRLVMVVVFDSFLEKKGLIEF